MNHLFFLKLILIVIGGQTNGNHIDLETPWGYKHEKNRLLPDDWDEIYENCDGHRQSPIDILANMTQFDANLRPLRLIQDFDENNNHTEAWEMRNNGHSSGSRFSHF
jgi:carbonic anhydrase